MNNQEEDSLDEETEESLREMLDDHETKFGVLNPEGWGSEEE